MKKTITVNLLLFLLLITPILLKAQEENTNLVQFSGVTITSDSLTAVPYTKVIIRNTKRGTTSDVLGYFSFVAHKNDTILFNALGFKPASFIIPDTIQVLSYPVNDRRYIDTSGSIHIPLANPGRFQTGLCQYKSPRRRP